MALIQGKLKLLKEKKKKQKSNKANRPKKKQKIWPKQQSQKILEI